MDIPDSFENLINSTNKDKLHISEIARNLGYDRESIRKWSQFVFKNELIEEISAEFDYSNGWWEFDTVDQPDETTRNLQVTSSLLVVVGLLLGIIGYLTQTIVLMESGAILFSAFTLATAYFLVSRRDIDQTGSKVATLIWLL